MAEWSLRRKIGLTAAILLFIFYWLHQGFYLIQKRIDPGLEMAARISVGTVDKNRDYDYDRTITSHDKNEPVKDPKCIGHRSKEPMGHDGCILVLMEYARKGCGWWYLGGFFGECEYFVAHEYLLNHPEPLGLQLAALHNPCKFLPKAKELKRLVDGKLGLYNQLATDYEHMRCGKADSGYKGRIIVSFQNNKGQEVARLEKPAEEYWAFFMGSYYQ